MASGRSTRNPGPAWVSLHGEKAVTLPRRSGHGRIVPGHAVNGLVIEPIVQGHDAVVVGPDEADEMEGVDDPLCIPDQTRWTSSMDLVSRFRVSSPWMPSALPTSVSASRERAFRLCSAAGCPWRGREGRVRAALGGRMASEYLAALGSRSGTRCRPRRNNSGGTWDPRRATGRGAHPTQKATNCPTSTPIEVRKKMLSERDGYAQAVIAASSRERRHTEAPMRSWTPGVHTLEKASQDRVSWFRESGWSGWRRISPRRTEVTSSQPLDRDRGVTESSPISTASISTRG